VVADAPILAVRGSPESQLTRDTIIYYTDGFTDALDRDGESLMRRNLIQRAA
jgi:serine phosphatase RsbU (regulator of sigma subunit)